MRVWLGVAVVVVRVYDITGLCDVDRRDAFDVAREALAAANVHVIFKDCAANEQSCAAPPRDNERIVRIINAPANSLPGTRNFLGNAIVDTGTETGILATIYADRIAQVSAGKTDRRLLLGRVVAHELGHLLLGVREHSDSGLMREFWTDEQVMRNQSLDWAYSAEDRHRICMNLLGRPSLCESTRGLSGSSEAGEPRD